MAFKGHHLVKHAKTRLRSRAGVAYLGEILGQLGVFLYPSGKNKRKEILLQTIPDLKFLLQRFIPIAI